MSISTSPSTSPSGPVTHLNQSLLSQPYSAPSNKHHVLQDWMIPYAVFIINLFDMVIWHQHGRGCSRLPANQAFTEHMNIKNRPNTPQRIGRHKIWAEIGYPTNVCLRQLKASLSENLSHIVITDKWKLHDFVVQFCNENDNDGDTEISNYDDDGDEDDGE